MALLVSLAACTATARWDRQESWADKSVGSFPYHPLVYHLDLSILAYQLHSQSLVWPIDPFYEEMGDRRDAYMAKVRAWANTQEGRDGLDAYRGPGVLGGFSDNPGHDPVLSRYGGLHPWSDAIANLDGRWIEMKTPKAITRRIGEAYVCYRKAGGPESEVVLERIPKRDGDPAPNARDVLLAFEGGTGGKGDPGQPPSQSILGFVLARVRPDARYDVHVAFRASRSGSASRAFLEAHWDTGGVFDVPATGNADWITDLGYEKHPHLWISTTGEVHRGFAHATRTCLPPLFRCLEEVARIRGGEPPVSIYVTGHSLGGALAQHLVGAVLLGDRYGPGGAGPAMPAALRDWPWKQIKLITYGAPRAGDARFAKALTESGLQSEFFSTLVNPQDSRALPPAEPSIVARLTDPHRPAGYRVLDSRDPLTTEKVVGGKHVGKTVYVNKPSVTDLVTLNFWAHDLVNLRWHLFNTFLDPRIPPVAVNYRELAELNPGRDESAKGSAGELKELAVGLERYYSGNGIWFDHAAFKKAMELRFAIEDGG